jgi:hypothetical protein
MSEEEEEGVVVVDKEYDEPVEGEENTFYDRRRRQRHQTLSKATTTTTAATGRDHLITFQAPVRDPNTMSVGYQVTDAVAYYSNMGLWALWYGRGTRGIVAPVLYDTQRGALATDPVAFDWDHVAGSGL